MKLIYSFGIYLYTLGIRIASPFHLKARQMVKGWKAIKDIPIDNSRPTAWFHAASLGEFEQARPVLEQFKQQHPDYRIWVTFFSPSGYEIRKNYALADNVTYLPMDTPRNARTLVKIINPSIVFFVKYEFWFNYLITLRNKNIPTYIFSAIFRPTQYFFKSYGKWFLQQLRTCFKHIFVQNEESLQLLRAQGITDCSIAGDTRFDRVHDIAQHVKSFPEIERFLTNNGTKAKVLIAGSSWEPDEEYLKEYLQHRGSDFKMILAPHVISESHLKGIENLFGATNCIRYSALSTLQGNPQILIIDNIGMLSSLYQYGDVAYIGGGWGRGIHNILEAITFGKPVVFGPNHKKFKEACDIIANEGGYTYTRYIELEKALDQLFDNAEQYEKSVQRCNTYMQQNLGSTEIILSKL